MEDIIQIENIISAFIGFGSAVIVAIVAGFFQISIARKNREILQKQIEQSKKEYTEKIEQLREKQRKANLERANDKLQAETKRFYNDLAKEMFFYDRLLNELHYLNNITNPKVKEIRSKGAYPQIDNNVKNLIGNVALPPDISKLLGALRANISFYNVALEQKADYKVLEEALARVYNLIDPINEERFENYANIQNSLRKFEIDSAKQIIQE